MRARWRELPSRRCFPGWRSAATAIMSTRAWARHRIPTGRSAKDDTGSGIVVYSFARWQDCAGAADSSAAGATGPGRKTQADRRGGRRQGSAVSGGDCGGWACRRGEAAGGRQSVRRCAADRCRRRGAIEKRFDLSESDAVPSTYPIALAVTKRWTARVCRAVECVGDCGTRSDEGYGGAQAGAAQAGEPRGAGHASLRVRAFRRMERHFMSRWPTAMRLPR